MQNPISKQDKILLPIMVGVAVILIAALLLYFLKFFGFSIQSILIKFMKTPENTKLYANILLVLLLCLFGLIAFIISLLAWRKDHDDIQRKKLWAFLLNEIARLKKERETLVNKPYPETPLPQLKEEGRFLDGQDEVLLRLSEWLKPPDK